jgi:hypothetical protein
MWDGPVDDDDTLSRGLAQPTAPAASRPYLGLQLRGDHVLAVGRQEWLQRVKR